MFNTKCPKQDIDMEKHRITKHSNYQIIKYQNRKIYKIHGVGVVEEARRRLIL